MVKPSPKQNATGKPESRSLMSRQFKGIRLRKWGKWVSEIRMPNCRAKIWLGSYDTPEKAARAYDFAAYCLRGSKARFNFPDSPPEMPCASSLSPPQIQAAAARFAAEEFRLPSDDDTASSSCGSVAESDFVPGIPCASSVSPPPIQAAEARFAAEEFRLPSDEDTASSSCGSVAESEIDSQQISAEQGSAFWDSLLLEDLYNGESLNLEDFPPIDLAMDDLGFLLQPTEDWLIF
jgi:hypothetical protein